MVHASSRVIGLTDERKPSASRDDANAADAAKRPTIVNAMSVDVEDYFQVRAFANVLNRNEWDGMPSRVEANTDHVLDLFAQKNVSATFFILGWVAERHPSLVRRIVSAGHEIASHGYGHEGLDCLTIDQFRTDIRRTKAVLEDIAQQRVRGYRAPTFSIGAKTWWAYQVLAEEGYAYSSSLYPIAHDLYGMPDAPRTPFRPIASPLLEIPLTTVRVFSRNYPASGGGFFRLLPYAVSRRLIAHVNRRDGNPCIFYWHPWEIDPGQPRIAGSSLRSRARHYMNLGAMARRIGFLLDDFSWNRMDNVFLKEPSLRLVK